MLLNTDSMCLVLCAAPLQGSNFKTMPSSPTQILQFQLNINNLGANKKCIYKEIQGSSNFWGAQKENVKNQGEKERLSVTDENWDSSIWSLKEYCPSVRFLNNISIKKKKKSNKPSSPPPLLNSSLGRGRAVRGGRGKGSESLPPPTENRLGIEPGVSFSSLKGIWYLHSLCGKATAQEVSLPAPCP